ncbi:hypothetical protein SmJEL517_g01721 [Synchytrium microbalum]|uniref:Fe2OG dioxygenase domain-containing protein n=1 Tax=Synchytrium microbalum TaxID=1806994 RepID=A0A507CDF7_9FUNG|nr:uncharacterized protein SmJEL517_g01721 [Synchytrium microbalum]TPX35954.1 hypothetical protein SmJEL517_g01721 [Synchytrium microbalum]
MTLKKTFHELFGDDSDDEPAPSPPIPTTFTEIPGLHLYRDHLPQPLLNRLLITVRAMLNPSEGRNQAMLFGNFPPDMSELADICKPLLPTSLRERQPAFNQSIVNHYEPGEGLAFHVDLMRFDDGIIVASLIGTCMFQFRRTCTCRPGGSVGCTCGRVGVDSDIVSVFLSAGDIILLTGKSRYDWEHGIRADLQDVHQGVTYTRVSRLSVTLRRHSE